MSSKKSAMSLAGILMKPIINSAFDCLFLAPIITPLPSFYFSWWRRRWFIFMQTPSPTIWGDLFKLKIPTNFRLG